MNFKKWLEKFEKEELQAINRIKESDRRMTAKIVLFDWKRELGEWAWNNFKPKFKQPQKHNFLINLWKFQIQKSSFKGQRSRELEISVACLGKRKIKQRLESLRGRGYA